MQYPKETNRNGNSWTSNSTDITSFISHCIYSSLGNIIPIILINNMTSVFKPDLFKGKLVLISGGATGICYEISKQFLKHNASVYIISRKIENINKAIKTLTQ